jgi:hypothetical protein
MVVFFGSPRIGRSEHPLTLATMEALTSSKVSSSEGCRKEGATGIRSASENAASPCHFPPTKQLGAIERKRDRDPCCSPASYAGAHGEPKHEKETGLTGHRLAA